MSSFTEALYRVIVTLHPYLKAATVSPIATVKESPKVKE